VSCEYPAHFTVSYTGKEKTKNKGLSDQKNRIGSTEEEGKMKKILVIPAIAVAVIAMSASGAFAHDHHFENGFKTELGAIAARATVGLGVGLVRGVVYPGHHCGPNCGHVYYAPPPPPPRFTRTVVYQPYPVPVRRVDTRVIYYRPAPPVYRPCN